MNDIPQACIARSPVTRRRDGKVGVGIVGAGIVSGGYLEFFSQNARTELCAVAEINSAVRDSVAKSYAPRLLTDDFECLIKSKQVDLVVVCTPHDLHYPVVMAALGSGKHVLCEKSLAKSVRESDEMLDAAYANGARLFASHNMRFGARIITLKEIIENGSLGRPFLAEFSYLGNEVARMSDLDNWKCDLKRAGGGVLLDGGCHMTDVLNACFGRATTVQALGGRLVVAAPNKGEDNAVVLIEYDSGVLAQLTASFTVSNVGGPGLILGMNVFGTGGSVFSTYNSHGLQEYMEVYRVEGKELIDLSKVAVPDKNQHFLDCLLTGREPLVTALDARNAVAVVEAAYESMRTGRRVEVDWRNAPAGSVHA